MTLRWVASRPTKLSCCEVARWYTPKCAPSAARTKTPARATPACVTATPEGVLEPPSLGWLHRERHLGGCVGERERERGDADGADQADEHHAPQERLDGIEHGEGEHEERVVLVEDRVGGPERLPMQPQEDVLPVTGEERAAGDPRDHRDRDAGPQRDTRAIAVEVARRAHPPEDAEGHATACDDSADQEQQHLGDERRPEDIGVVEARVVQVAGAQPEEPPAERHQHDDGHDDDRDDASAAVARRRATARAHNARATTAAEYLLGVEAECAHGGAECSPRRPATRCLSMLCAVANTARPVEVAGDAVSGAGAVASRRRGRGGGARDG